MLYGGLPLVWIGIVLCLSQSALFSGSNLAFYRLSRLRLELDAKRDPRAGAILRLRNDSNFLLATILWGNVAINVLLALLANSVLIGVLAFVFSTFVITWFGEIMPQAYFSRHPLRTAAALAPIDTRLSVPAVPGCTTDGQVSRLVAGQGGHRVSA